MKIPVFPALRWNRLAAAVRRAWPYPGTNARLSFRGGRHTITGADGLAWRHPWQLSCSYEYYLDADGEPVGEWRARVRPGFVNGRDSWLSMPADWQENPDPSKGSEDVPLTSDPAPWLRLLSWRDPAASQGIGNNDDGDITYGPAEGYPDFFISIGVKPPAPGGLSPDAPYDPARDRQIRACDVWINAPRLGSALSVTPLDPTADSQSGQLDTTFSSSVYVSMQGRSKLQCGDQFTPIQNNDSSTAFDGLPMNTTDSELDQILLGTVFLVSPPGYGDEDEPDETWEDYPQSAVFWNLWHATRFMPITTNADPITFNTGLGDGMLDYLANAMLAPVNDADAAIAAYLNNADMRGVFWNG